MFDPREMAKFFAGIFIACILGAAAIGALIVGIIWWLT